MSAETTTSFYAGPDRRARPVTGARLIGAGYALSVAVLVALVVVAIRPPTALATASLGSLGLHGLVGAAGAALAAAGAALYVLRWRIAGEAPPLSIAFALAVLTTAITLDAAGPLGDPSWIAGLRGAGALAAGVLLARAALQPTVDTRFALARAAAQTLLLFGVLWIAVMITTALRFAPDDSAFWVRVLTAVTMLGAAPIAFRRALREDQTWFAWAALAAVAFAIASLVRAATSADPEWLVGTSLLRLVGALYMLVGIVRDLKLRFAAQRRQLLDTLTRGTEAEVRLQAQREAHEERTHEARSALAAIDVATRVLERSRDRLSRDQRESLNSAIAAEVTRLQTLIADDSQIGPVAPFSVSAVIADATTAERAAGSRVVSDVAGELRAVAREDEIRTVLTNLLINARRYAPGSPIFVTARREGDRVVVRVEDEGPGVAPSEREDIFRRGYRGTAASGIVGAGVGLSLAADILRRHGGELTVTDAPRGGASFRMSLPAADASMPADVG